MCFRNTKNQLLVLQPIRFTTKLAARMISGSQHYFCDDGSLYDLQKRAFSFYVYIKNAKNLLLRDFKIVSRCNQKSSMNGRVFRFIPPLVGHFLGITNFSPAWRCWILPMHSTFSTYFGIYRSINSCFNCSDLGRLPMNFMMRSTMEKIPTMLLSPIVVIMASTRRLLGIPLSRACPS